MLDPAGRTSTCVEFGSHHVLRIITHYHAFHRRSSYDSYPNNQIHIFAPSRILSFQHSRVNLDTAKRYDTYDSYEKLRSTIHE